MLGKGLESLIPNKGGPSGQNSLSAPPVQKEEPKLKTEPPVAEPVPPLPSAELPKEAPRAIPSIPEKQVRPATRGEREGSAIFHIEVEKIKPNPHQPRRDFNEEALRDLANSIREFGVLQPVIVTKIEKEVPTGTEVEYELIAGERRLMAAKLLGLERVPAIIKKVSVETERLEMAIIENLQRENLNPLETARAFARLQDEFRMTQREIAMRLGKSREVVANTLRLLDLPSYIQDAIIKGHISETHGRLLLAVTDSVSQEKLFRDLLDRHLTTRDLRNRVSAAKSGLEEAAPREGLSSELKMLQEKLSSELGAPVVIQKNGETGKITISFYSGEELKNIVERLAGEEI